MTPLKRDGQPPNYNPRHLTLTKLSYESSYSIKHEKQVRIVYPQRRLEAIQERP